MTAARHPRALLSFAATLVITATSGAAQDLTGTWEGNYRCNNGSAEAAMTIARGDGRSHEVHVRWTGIGRGQGGQDTFRVTLDPGLGSVVFAPTGASARGERGVNLEISGLLSADGQRLTGRFRGGRCQTVEFRRTGGPAPGPSASGQVFGSQGPQVGAPPAALGGVQSGRRSVLTAASETEACQILVAWANRFLEEYPRPEERRRAPEANLVRDEHFVPMIGRPFASIDIPGFRQLARIRSNCRNKGFLSREVDHVSQLLNGASQRELHRQLAAYPQVLEWRSRALDALNRTTPTVESIRSLDDLENRARAELALLWPSEQRQFQQTIDARRRVLVAPAMAAIAGANPDAPLDLATIERLHALADAVGGAAEPVRARVDRAIERHVAAALRTVATFPASLEGRAAFDRWAAALDAEIARYAHYPQVTNARQRIDAERRALDGRIDAALDREIAAGLENFARFPPTAENRALMVDWQRQVETAMAAYAAYPVAAALPQRFAEAREAFDARIDRAFIETAAPASAERLERLWSLAQKPNAAVAAPARAAALRELAQLVEQRLAGMPPAEQTREGLTRFDSWQLEFDAAFKPYADAPPVRAAAAMIADRRSSIARVVALADIRAIASAPATATTLDGLQRFAGSDDRQVAAAASAAIDRMLPELIVAEVAAAPAVAATIGGWSTLALWEEGLRRRFTSFDGRDAVREGLAVASRKVEMQREMAARSLEEMLTAAATPGPFLSVVEVATGGARPRPGGDAVYPFRAIYLRTLDAWMEREVAASRTAPSASASATAPAPSAAGTAATPVPTSSNPLGSLVAPTPVAVPSAQATAIPTTSGANILALRYVQPRLVAGFYLRDFTRVDQDRGYVANYLTGMVGIVRQSCASAVPGELVQSLMESQGVRIPTSNEDMAQQGLNALAQFMTGMANPAQMMQSAMSVGQARDAGDADARTLVENIPCQGPDLLRIMTNAATWLRDPTAGIPAASLSMADLCRRVWRRENCGCIGSQINSRTNGIQRRFAALNDGQNLDLLVKLMPSLEAAWSECRRQ